MEFKKREELKFEEKNLKFIIGIKERQNACFQYHVMNLVQIKRCSKASINRIYYRINSGLSSLLIMIILMIIVELTVIDIGDRW